MNHFEAVYPADRASQLRHLTNSNLLSGTAVDLLNQFAARYGCIARDLGMFPSAEPDSIILTWNVPITDVREGGRKRNSLIASLHLRTSHITFQDGSTAAPVEAQWESIAIDHIIEAHRTC